MNFRTETKNISELRKGDQVRFYGVVMEVTGDPLSWEKMGWGNPKDPLRHKIYSVPCRITDWSKENEKPVDNVRGLLYTYDTFQGVEECTYEVIIEKDKVKI